MTYATNTDRSLSTGSRWAAVRADLAERFARYRTYRQTLAELEALNDRDLADLGVSRFDIRGIARDAAYKA